MNVFCYRTSEVAELLSISVGMAKKLVQTGEIDSVKIGRSRRVTHTAVKDYIAKLEAASLEKAS